MGEARTDRPSPDLDRLTVAQAADALSISQDAVRKRIARGTIPHDRDDSGRVYVYLSPSETVHKTDQDTIQDDATKTVQDAYIRSLQDQIAFLRQELERKDQILLNLTEQIPELEAPTEAQESSETAEEEPERAESRSSTGGAVQEPTRPPAPSALTSRLGMSARALAVGGIATLLVWFNASWSLFLNSKWWFVPPDYIALISALPILVPLLSGLWAGSTKRPSYSWFSSPHRWLRRGGRSVLRTALFAIGIPAGVGYFIVDAYFWSLGYFGWELLPVHVLSLVLVFLLALFPFMSGALLGNAWQRRRIGRVSDTTPSSPVSHTMPSSGQQPRKDLTPTQQAILGWGGAIISALITLAGTLVLGRGGP